VATLMEAEHIHRLREIETTQSGREATTAGGLQ
jgi:hypothetical protein